MPLTVRAPFTLNEPCVVVPAAIVPPPLGGVIVKWSPEILEVVPPAQVIWLTTVGLYEYPPIVITGAERVAANTEPVKERPYPAVYALWAAVSASDVPERLPVTPLQLTVST